MIDLLDFSLSLLSWTLNTDKQTNNYSYDKQTDRHSESKSIPDSKDFSSGSKSFLENNEECALKKNQAEKLNANGQTDRLIFFLISTS